MSRVLIVGEVLWDCFPQHRVLGGAPFNVAWNLAGFGVDPVMVSAVGEDELGQEILNQMRRWGLTTECIEVHADRPTGTVEVTLNNGEPTYNITTGVAWDAISEPDVDLDSIDILYCGSLAWRSETTRNTILKLRKKSLAPVFVDINIRMPYFDEAWLKPMLDGAEFVKLNEDELSRIGGKIFTTELEREHAVQELIVRHRIHEIYVTRGAAGVEWYNSDGARLAVTAPQPKKWVDAVGAGDAFAAVVLWGQLQKIEHEKSLNDAVQFAADVCGLSGATTEDRAFYQRGGTLTIELGRSNSDDDRTGPI